MIHATFQDVFTPFYKLKYSKMTSSRQRVSSHIDAVAVLEVQHPTPGAGEAGILDSHCLLTQNCNPTAEMAPRPTLPNSALQKGPALAGPDNPSRRARPTSPR